MYKEWLTVLTKLLTDITVKLEGEAAGESDPLKIEEYEMQLKQIKSEINRVEKSQGYTKK